MHKKKRERITLNIYTSPKIQKSLVSSTSTHSLQICRGETKTLMKRSTEDDRDFHFKSEAESFLVANCINHNAHHPSFQISDIEMVALQALTYTSLKDLMPASPPTITMSPTYDQKDSWLEIPIKDPLVQHAARAYLLPMSTAPEADNRSCLAKLMDKCCGGLFGCLGGFLDDVVWRTINSLFSGNKNNIDAFIHKVE